MDFRFHCCMLMVTYSMYIRYAPILATASLASLGTLLLLYWEYGRDPFPSLV